MKLAAAAARRFVASPAADVGAALFFGPNRALVGEYCASVADKIIGGSDDPFGLTRLAEDEIKRDRARLADALAAQSLLGGPRLVWARIDGEAASESLVAAVAQIDAGARLAFLLVEGGDLGSKGKTVAAFEKAERSVSIACYEETEAERSAWLRALIESQRVPFSADARDYFLGQAPADRALARGELEKIALFAHDLGRSVELDDVRALAAHENDSIPDEAVIAALSGRTGPALDLLDRLDGGNGVSVLKAMERRLLRLLEARHLVDGGVNPAEAGDRLKPKVFWKERDLFAGQVRRWNVGKLVAALELVAAAEKRAKTAGAPQIEIAAGAYRAIAALL